MELGGVGCNSNDLHAQSGQHGMDGEEDGRCFDFGLKGKRCAIGTLCERDGTTAIDGLGMHDGGIVVGRRDADGIGCVDDLDDVVGGKWGHGEEGLRG